MGDQLTKWVVMNVVEMGDQMDDEICKRIDEMAHRIDETGNRIDEVVTVNNVIFIIK